MPKVKWFDNYKASTPKAKKPRAVPADYIIEMFDRYRKANNILRADMALVLNMTPESISAKKKRGCGGFTLSEFRDWVKALQIPDDVAADAIKQYLEGKQ